MEKSKQSVKSLNGPHSIYCVGAVIDPLTSKPNQRLNFLLLALWLLDDITQIILACTFDFASQP